MASKIEDYALVGDCHTGALIARDGSADWLCWPRFDSDACFAALLGEPRHGRWLIAPQSAGARVLRRYRQGTLVLETDFETAEGAVRIVDFMPARGSASHLVRIVRGLRGRVPMRMELILRFNYGASVPWVSRLPDGSLSAVVGGDRTVLRTRVPLHGEGLKTVGRFTVRAGASIPFVLSYGLSYDTVAPPIDPAAALEATEAFWRQWSDRCSYSGQWSDAVSRSLITLKALTFAPTGGIVAAPTTSLPERLGGVRNWDYRFCWLRDATLALLALMHAGYFEEADAWRRWLQRAVAGSPEQLQIMYGLAGERRLDEWILEWLPGHARSRPVRVGNAAARQFQLDIYGEVIDALHQARKGGLKSDAGTWAIQCKMLEHLESVWSEPDRGLWEVRGRPRHFTYSKVMAWVGVDRAVKSVERFGLDGPLRRWRALRRRIHNDVCRNGFNASMKSFVQSYGSREVDASLLLIPVTGFLPPHDVRVRGTLAAIERELTVDGLVLRYRSNRTLDGLPRGEGFFLACSFWLADNLVLQGRRDEALALFERLLSLRNDVGLLAEEYEPRARRMLGNFPQAFSHVALVNTALNLTREESPVRQRSGETAPRRASRRQPAGTTRRSKPSQ
ncbi:MAG TPA: glycoside hydrolase family 15 protein [Casimicrobiaceae bacterium]|nr:glycoside hydrolase family 15 protein [Casimicrobiaceae bacterium]